MRLSVGAKLLGGFELVVLMAIVLGVVGMSSLAAMNELAIQLYNRDLIGLQDIAQARAAFDSYRLASAQSLAASNPTERSLQASRQASADAAFAQALASIQSAADTADSGTLSGQLATRGTSTSRRAIRWPRRPPLGIFPTQSKSARQPAETARKRS